MRDLQDQLSGDDLTDVDLAVSQLQEALYGLNRRLAKERSQDSNPLQGLKNTLGSLKDELFADDDWDDWDRGRSRDPWSEPGWGASGRSGLGFNGSTGLGDRFGESRFEEPRYSQRFDAAPRYDAGPRYDERPYDDRRYDNSRYDNGRDDEGLVDNGRFYDRREDNRRNSRFDVATAGAGNTPRQDPFEGDPWAED